VLEPERSEERNPVLAVEPIAELREHLVARRRIRAAEDVRPQRARVVDVHVELSACERAKRDRRAEADPLLGGRTLRLDALRDQLREDELLREVLRADDIHRAA